MDELLDIRNIPDYPNALNGLQLANQHAVVKIAAAVDFSSQTITSTIEHGASMMIVHHGMFWDGSAADPWTASLYTNQAHC